MTQSQEPLISDPFPVRGHCLCPGGLPLDDLIARAGGTPLYIYDRERVSDRVQQLRAVLPETMALHYAIKANPMPALLHHMGSLVDGLDVASGAELQRALDAGMPATAISFAGPGKRDPELYQALAAGATVNVESTGELDRLNALGAQHGYRPRVALRVNPDFELKAAGMRMGGGPQVFGIDAEDVPAVLEKLAGMAVDFRGLQVFTGSQNLAADNLATAHERILELAERLASHAPVTMPSLNIGGGLGIPYFPGDQPLDREAVGAHLTELAARAADTLPGTQLILELGRYLVGEAGLYVTRVIDRKVSRGHVFLVTDGGLHHHLAASGNFGQVIRRNYPVAIGNRMDQPAAETVTVTGPLCTPLDVLARDAHLPEAMVGDLVVVFQSGAYGLTASPTAFLSHPPPGEVLV